VGGGIGVKIIATVRYRCETCGSIEVQHTHNRLNEGCCGCGATIAFERVRNIYTKELNDPWVTVEGEEMLKLLIFKMLPDPQKPALASTPP
jgi:predicted  nucleic acid-binding Zn-ribbon protein